MRIAILIKILVGIFVSKSLLIKYHLKVGGIPLTQFKFKECLDHIEKNRGRSGVSMGSPPDMRTGGCPAGLFPRKLTSRFWMISRALYG